MKIICSCMECNKNATPETFKSLLIELKDENLYEVVCPVGHSFTIVLQENKFEILFELGVLSIIDGYYREAISNFAVSLERVYEYYMNIICISKDIDHKDFLDSWKLIRNQSERQLGAFIYLYLLENQKCPSVLSQKSVELRNKVVHKGYFPTREETVRFGDEVVDLISILLLQILEQYKQAEIEYHYISSKELIEKRVNTNAPVVSTSIPTSIRMSTPSLIGTKKIEEMIKDRENFRILIN